MISKIPMHDNEIPVPLEQFIEHAMKGGPDHIYALLMKIEHEKEKHTMAMWKSLLEAKKVRPILPTAR